MNISRATAEDLIELLEELLEYMDKRADADTLSDGTVYPNTEMTFVTNIKETLSYLRFPDDPS